MFLLYAPHLGISKDGEIGMKDGKRDFSFTMDAYDAILKEQKSPSEAKSEQVPEENHQFEHIKEYLKKKMPEISKFTEEDDEMH